MIQPYYALAAASRLGWVAETDAAGSVGRSEVFIHDRSKETVLSTPFLEVEGTCPTCDREVVFSCPGPVLRDRLLCSHCGSLPRERALMHVIEQYYPDFAELAIHESSPFDRGTSRKLASCCGRYTTSHFDESIPAGTVHPSLGHRSEDLEGLTFPDESFDLVITQDVLEHVFDPETAFAEIARVLKPGGAHVFTTPLVHGLEPSVRCAELADDGSVRHLEPAEYHGHPLHQDGSLVTMRWGYDISHWVYRASGLITTILAIDRIELGIRAELNEVLLSFKPATSSQAPPLTSG